MSQPITQVWLPSTGNEAAICPLQGAVAPPAGGLTPLVLNTNSSQGFSYPGLLRSIIIKAGADSLAGVNFTIVGIGCNTTGTIEGTLDGDPIEAPQLKTFVIAGPLGNASKETPLLFSSISSISVSAVIANNMVSVGFGTYGITQYVNMDYNRQNWVASIQVMFSELLQNPTIEVTPYYTLKKLQTSTLDGMTIPDVPVVGMTILQVDNNVVAPIDPCSTVWLSVKSTTSGQLSATTITFTTLQVGI